MLRPLSLAVAAVAALAACGGEAPAPPAAAPHAAVSDRPAGTLVYVSGGNRLAAVDVASSRRRVRRVSSLAACGPELHVTDGRVVFSGIRRDRTIVYSAPLTLDRPPLRLGPAHLVVPSATEGRVWLLGVDCHRSAMVGVREFTVDGQVTVDSRRRVPGTWVDAAAPEGLLVRRRRALLIWDPRSGRTVRRLALDAVFGGRRDLLVGCTAASDCSDVAVADATSARTVVARLPGWRLDGGGELSPDGKRLAAPVRHGRRWGVALVDARTGEASLIRGSRTGRAYPFVAWSVSSGWLFIRGGGGRVLAYRPGAARAVRLPLRLPPEAVSFAAG
jgi:hypothetical protein